MDDFTPLPLQIVTAPEQIKAFTDPLRARVLRMLSARAYTNQQLADTLEEPHAKVLYHIRFLLEVGLIKLVDTQIKGGNVEKYYRAIARVFDLRPGPDAAEDTHVALSGAYLDNLRRDFLSSVVRFPDVNAYIHSAAARMPQERMEEFNRRLLDLIAEYWKVGPEHDQLGAPRVRLNVQIYRDADDQRET